MGFPYHAICECLKIAGISIKDIDPSIHTINDERIIAITKTVSLDEYLVCFEKHSLGFNKPSRNTIMSKDHKILYKGEMYEADNFVGLFKNVKKIQYNGEYLYNILMENYNTVIVNRLICETLDPENLLSKIYTSNLSQSYKNKFILTMNESIINNDYSSYKKIINHL